MYYSSTRIYSCSLLLFYLRLVSMANEQFSSLAGNESFLLTRPLDNSICAGVFRINRSTGYHMLFCLCLLRILLKTGKENSNQITILANTQSFIQSSVVSYVYWLLHRNNIKETKIADTHGEEAQHSLQLRLQTVSR